MNINDDNSLPDQPESRDIDKYINLYSSVQKRLYIYIVTLVFDAGDAEDLLQETNLLLWSKFDQFEQGSNFWAWARQVARNNVLNYWQLKRHTSTTVLSNAALEAVDQRAIGCSQKEDGSRKEALNECLEKLKPDDREIILNRYEPGFSLGETASLLNIERNTLSKKLGRIRNFLQNCVAKTIARES